jgi:hypothetical protein
MRYEQQESRDETPANVQGGNEKLANAREEPGESASVGDQENPYRRDTYRPSTRESRWCHDEECNIQGTHKVHLGIHFAYAAAEDTLGDPRSYKEALSSHDADRWMDAMKEEYKSLMLNRTWTLCELPAGANVVGTAWKYKTKHDQDGKRVKDKARLVAQGFSQKPGVDYLTDRTFAPVAKFTSIRSVLALAAREDWHLHNMDVDTARIPECRD